MKNYKHPMVQVNQDLEVPKLGMGTWQIKGSQCVQCVQEALEIGYRSIDTAQAYENEKEVGQGLKESQIPRDEIFLTSKVWRDNLSKEDVIKTTEKSLENLQTDYVDLMLIHWPNEKYDLKDSLHSLIDLKKSGKVRNFGLSNFPTTLLQNAQEIAPDFVCDQVEYHPYLNQDKVLEWLKKHNKFLIAYSPLARGKVFKDETIKKIAENKNISHAQVTLSWLLRQDRVVAIPKSSSKKHLESNWKSQKVVLDDQELTELNGLTYNQERLIDPEWSPKWD